MITCRLLGGLGNQMFQYSFGYALAKTRNEELRFDSSFYSIDWLSNNRRFTPQKLGITSFDVSRFEEAAVPKDVVKKLSFIQKKNVSRLLFLFSNPRINLVDGFTYVKETRFVDNSNLINNLDWENVYFDGYWQCPSFFEQYKNELKQQFIPVSISDAVYRLSQYLISEGYISIHIRRGDYLTNVPFYSKIRILPLDFFKASMKLGLKETGIGKFLVFSNDINWVKENLDFPNLFFLNDFGSFSDIEEMYLMSHCRCNIISNSTFSWWGAFLNRNDNNLVIAPSNCFGNKDMMCKDWRIIDTGL